MSGSLNLSDKKHPNDLLWEFKGALTHPFSYGQPLNDLKKPPPNPQKCPSIEKTTTQKVKSHSKKHPLKDVPFNVKG